MTSSDIAMIVSASLHAASQLTKTPGLGYKNDVANAAKTIAAEMIAYALNVENGLPRGTDA